MSRKVAAGSAVVVLAVIAVAAWLVWPRGSSPVTLEEARADLEERRQADADAADDRTPEALRTRVDEYSVDGTQSVGLGGVTDEDRVIAETVNVGIDATGNGCFELTLNLVDQHVERTPGTRSDLVCDMDVSVAVVETTGEATGVAVVGEVEDVVVSDEASPAVPVEMTDTMEGAMAGSWTQHYWLDAATPPPLRISAGWI